MATANDQSLDPATLRLLADELDGVAERFSKACPCKMHRTLASKASDQAADYRTRALKVDVVAREGTTLARALAEVDAWLVRYDEASARAPQLVDGRGVVDLVRYIVAAYRATRPVKIDRSNT